MGAVHSAARCLETVESVPPNDGSSPIIVPPPRLASVLDLPPEVFAIMHLPLAALCSLACTCSELQARLPEELWRPEMLRLLQSMNAVLQRLPLISNTRISGPTHPAGLLHDEDTQLLTIVRTALSSIEASPSSRVFIPRLRANACVMCSLRGTSGTSFPLTARGLCVPCEVDRPRLCDLWRKKQAAREDAMRTRANELTRSVLLSALGEALLERRPTGQPVRVSDLRLLFDSNRGGNSLAALLRAADEAPASILLIRERCSSESSANDAPRTSQPHIFGAFVPSRWSARRGDSFFSDSRTFLFSLTPMPPQIYPAREATASHCVHASPIHGIGFGGNVGCFGLRLRPDLMSGERLPSLTFGDCASLASAAEFVADNVQLWSVGEDTEPRRRARSSWEATGDESVVEDSESKLMLEFIGMERSLAYDARYGK